MHADLDASLPPAEKTWSPLRHRGREAQRDTRDRGFTYTHLPCTDIYIVCSNNLSFYFCQCTVLLQPLYNQPHDNVWLLTLLSVAHVIL